MRTYCVMYEVEHRHVYKALESFYDLFNIALMRSPMQVADILPLWL